MRKNVLIVFLIFTTQFSIYSQCVKGDCFNGDGMFKAKNGTIYQGQFAMGKFHGKGVLSFPSNDKYLGQFKNGRKEGNGKYIFAAGHEYIGSFLADKRSGNGTMTYSNKDIYEGQWSNDMPNGKGIYKFSDGSTFEGLFNNGNFNGEGVFTESNGSSYTGLWKNNVLISKQQSDVANEEAELAEQVKEEVKTEAKDQNKVRIKDCTNQYCNNEKGKFVYRDGSYFIGEFVAGEPEGEGACHYVNGDMYKGGWKSHGPHGNGTMFKKDGSVHSGLWDLGSLKKRSYETEALAKINKAKETKKESYNDEITIYAVIVGVATYNHMSSLKYTDDDAYHLYAFLKSPEGGAIPDENISILIDESATKRNISREISNTFAKADANDVIMLYMSGHGLEGSFVPADFDGLNNLLAYNDILNLIEASQAKHKLYVTDACHSGSMYAAKAPFQMELADFYTRISRSAGGTAVITSSKKDEVSLEYSGMRHGVFSHYLIQGLKGDANKNSDKFISVEELFNYVFMNVRHHTNNGQTPSIHGDYDKEMPVSFMR